MDTPSNAGFPKMALVKSSLILIVLQNLFLLVTRKYAGYFRHSTVSLGHMEKQETEIKWKPEMETGNKPETENRNGNATSSLL